MRSKNPRHGRNLPWIAIPMAPDGCHRNSGNSQRLHEPRILYSGLQKRHYRRQHLSTVKASRKLVHDPLHPTHWRGRNCNDYSHRLPNHSSVNQAQLTTLSQEVLAQRQSCTPLGVGSPARQAGHDRSHFSGDTIRPDSRYASRLGTYRP